MHVVDMQNCTDFTTTYLPTQYHFSFFFTLSSLKYDIFVLHYTFTLLTRYMYLGHLSSFFEHYRENKRTGRKHG